VQQALVENRTEEFEEYDSEIKRYRGYRFVNDIPLNKIYPDLLVNFLEYWEVDEAGGGTSSCSFTWPSGRYGCIRIMQRKIPTLRSLLRPSLASQVHRHVRWDNHGPRERHRRSTGCPIRRIPLAWSKDTRDLTPGPCLGH
jgi:hypothetical protein